MVMNPMEAVSYNTKIEKQLFFLPIGLTKQRV